jgi:hypothetical protein
MSLRNADADSNGGSTHIAGKRWSISARLAMLHILSVAGSFLACAGMMFAIMAHHMEMENDKGLREEGNAIKVMLRLPDGGTLLARELETQKYETDTIRPLIRVLDVNGRILQESSGMTRVLSPAVFPAFEEEQGKALQKTVHANTYLLRTFTLPRNALSS